MCARFGARIQDRAERVARRAASPQQSRKVFQKLMFTYDRGGGGGHKFPFICMTEENERWSAF